MNKDQVKGRAEEAKGKIKEATGKVVGSDRMKAEGQADQLAGKAQANLGDLRNDVKKAVDRK